MNPEFWQEKWNKNEIGFHLKSVHPLLKKHLSPARLNKVNTVFVPLCGKTLDIAFLLEKGLNVLANELSETAVAQLFESLNFKPNITTWSGGQCYSANNLTVWVGDFFQLSLTELNQAQLDQTQLGKVDLIYDRAALIALPPEMRKAYAQHLQDITDGASQLLITLSYDQTVIAGPPFSVPQEEVQEHYAKAYNIECLSSKDIIEYESKFAQRGLNSLVERADWLE